MTIRDKELTLVSLVVTFDPSDIPSAFPTLNVPSLESAFGATLQVEPLLSDRGQGRVLRIPKHRLQILMLPDRIELRSQEEELQPALADHMASDLYTVTAQFPQGIWRLIGYNFEYVVDTTDRAIELIGTQVLNVSELSSKLGYRVLGGSVGLWMEVDNSVLWLRIEPRRSDRESNRIWVNANFTEEIAGQIPPKDTIEANISSRHNILKRLLSQVSLW